MPRANDALYRLLETGPEATPRGLRHNYRRIAERLARKAGRGDAAARDRLKEVEHAWAVLSDPDRRQRYDRYGEPGLQPGFVPPDEPRHQPGPSPSETPSPPPAAAQPGTAVGADRWWSHAPPHEAPPPRSPGSADRPGPTGSPSSPPGAAHPAAAPPTEPKPPPEILDVEYELIELPPSAPEAAAAAEEEPATPTAPDATPEPEAADSDAAGPAPKEPAPAPPADVEGPIPDAGDVDEITDVDFDEAPPQQTRESAPRADARAQVVDGRLQVELPFRLACLGGSAEIYIGDEPFTLHIAPGTDSGTEVEVDQVPIVYKVEPHPIFVRSGRHLLAEVQLELGQILRGVEVTVPTLRAAACFRVPRGCRDGQVLRLRGLGVPDAQGGQGHLLVALRVAGQGLPRVRGFSMDASGGR